MMYHIPGVLSAQDVTGFVNNWTLPTGLMAAQPPALRGAGKNNQQVNTQSERYGVLQQAVQTAVSNSALFFAAALPKTLSTPMFNRYQTTRPTVFTLTVRCVAIRKTAGCARTFPQLYS